MLEELANSLNDNKKEIIKENNRDYLASKNNIEPSATLERLVLSENSIDSIISSVLNIVTLPDPIADTFDHRELDNGLKVYKQRVPLGVIGVIYESRPNVTIDISALCIKSGNCAILRGGKESIHTNVALTKIIQNCLKSNHLPENAITLIENTDRRLVIEMLKLKQYIDLIIPRGSANLVRLVAEHAEMPAITGGIGISHIYIDADADINKAISITSNSKLSNPYVCNALDTILIHKAIANEFLKNIVNELSPYNVQIRCDENAVGKIIF